MDDVFVIVDETDRLMGNTFFSSLEAAMVEIQALQVSGAGSQLTVRRLIDSWS
jgi:hypothetical protein